jgi:xanthine dehydrogenase YagR molybdenum-binding subunit
MSVGTAHTRVEGAVKVRGAAKYAADVYPEGTLFASTVGAPVAAGRVTGIDAARALAVPGVVRVLTAADMPRIGKLAMPACVLKPPMQGDWIEWEGQPVAIVLAESTEAAEEAASLVRVGVEREAAMVPGRGRLEVPPDHFAKAKEAKGSVAAGLAQAATTIRQS